MASTDRNNHRSGIRVFQRKRHGARDAPSPPDHEVVPQPEQEKAERGELQQQSNGEQVQTTKGIQPDGESGRSWFHPLHFFKICWSSSSHVSKWTNVLWPFTIAALVLYFNFKDHPLWIFITAYIGMVPAANLLGFGGQELARKIPKVMGVILETTFGSFVEIILFMVLIAGGNKNVPVIQAAILGSILANMLLCLGICFFVGGLVNPHQEFHEAFSEVGSNLMLVAGMGLIIPSIYYNSLSGNAGQQSSIANLTYPVTLSRLSYETKKISYATAVVLLVAFFAYVFFQARTHHSMYEDILEADEEMDHDRERDLAKPKLTLTEAIFAVVLAIMFVAFMAVILVSEIEYIVTEHNVSDHFMGLILVPIVEKASEHLTAMDEAYDNQMNFALAHVLGASIQTALLNTPLVVFVGWGLGREMDLNFQLFDSVVLILAILVVGNFLRDEKSDYLEGALCVFVYILIAITAYYYPNPHEVEMESSGGEGAARLMLRALHG